MEASKVGLNSTLTTGKCDEVVHASSAWGEHDHSAQKEGQTCEKMSVGGCACPGKWRVFSRLARAF
ncbi:hypothetical protein JZ751_007971 [Albula glossodonta]|uniref:Uncharacterized protein n=1 Tax=Albula glossodonta TaxID=121402 RepID=A0A8T2NYJ6_9TELE|nr:hypothetical protein JZ751_007971 [Albula glossodonta]